MENLNGLLIGLSGHLKLSKTNIKLQIHAIQISEYVLKLKKEIV